MLSRAEWDKIFIVFSCFFDIMMGDYILHILDSSSTFANLLDMQHRALKKRAQRQILSTLKFKSVAYLGIFWCKEWYQDQWIWLGSVDTMAILETKPLTLKWFQRGFRLFSDVWSENASPLRRLMKIHSNPPILYNGFNRHLLSFDLICLPRTWRTWSVRQKTLTCRYWLNPSHLSDSANR